MKQQRRSLDYEETMTAIEVKNLNKTFEKTIRKGNWFKRLKARAEVYEAVKNISFSAEEGESIAFIGPNGAGKSTTIKMLTGILHPTSGETKVLGLVPWKDRKKLAYQIGSVFGQKSQLWLHLPPQDTFELLGRIYELDDSFYEKRKNELIELFELKDFVNVPTRKLSLGQRMRCEIAASLLHKPKVIFLDEPTIGLDPVAKASIRELISRANKEEKVTVFLTSHDAGDIERLCKRVIIINHGQMIFDDSTNRLKRDFLRKKEIDLKLTAPWESELIIPGVDVAKSKGFGMKLSVDLTQNTIERVVSDILKKGSVEDITIQNMPMEEIIADIYRRQAVL